MHVAELIQLLSEKKGDLEVRIENHDIPIVSIQIVGVDHHIVKDEATGRDKLVVVIVPKSTTTVGPYRPPHS
jgi:hypothetical protein